MNKVRQLFGALAVGALVLILCASGAQAQDVTASITGTITDQSGGAVAGAKVTAKSTDRGNTLVAETNEAGIYRFSELPVGTYDLRVEKQGFQTSVHPQFTLVLNQVARVDFELKVGQVSQTVEVSGAPPILTTESTQVETIIDSRTNVALPLATRNYVQLTMLAPGAVHPDPSQFNTGDNVNSGARPFINGNREQSDNFLLDGMDNNEVSDNLLGYTPSPDAIEEFNLITNNAPAEFGNFMGGIVSATIKSGTNSFHGGVFEFFRNNVLNANEWGNMINPTSPAIPRPDLRFNMFGGTLGGPIYKNKLFFFVDYQGQRFDHPPTASYITVYTPAEMQGDFSALLNQATPVQLFNPCQGTTGQNGTPCVAAAVRQPFAGNQIPLSMISPVAAALFASPLYPKAINGNLVNNAQQLTGSSLNSNQGDIKIDYKISDKDQVSGRFTRSMQSDPNTNSQPLLGNSQVTAPIWSTVGDWTRAISPNLVNDMRFGWNHVVLNTGPSWDPSVGQFGQSIGIANSNPAGVAGLLLLGFGGGTPTSPGTGVLTNMGNSMVVQNFNSQVYQYNDSVTWTRGRHTLRFGGEYMFDIITAFYSGNSGSLGGLTFGPIFTASSAIAPAANTGEGSADFFLGLPVSFGRGLPSGQWIQTSNVFSGYAQDTWRVNSGLTLTLGLRYEAHTPWIERNDLQSNYNMQTGLIEYANQNNASRALYNGTYGGKDFQPRLGFAWTPEKLGGRTVFRGAFTVSSYLEGTGTNLRLPLNAPFDGGAPGSPEFQTQYLNQSLPNTTASQGIIAPPNTGLSCPNYSCYAGIVFRLWDPNVQPAIDDQWNLTVQHQFAGNITAQIGYVGQVAYHLMVPFSYGQLVAQPNSACGTPPCTAPSPYFAANEQLANLIGDANVSGTQSNGRMMYNGLQAVLQKTMSNGLEAQVAYTYAKCMSNNTGYYGTWSGAKQSTTASPYWQNVYDPKAEWAPCYYDETQNLTAYAVYELPFGSGKKFGNDMNKVANAVVGGWTVSPIMTLHTGFPMALYTNASDPTNTGSRGLRPDCNGTNTIYGRRQAPGGVGGGYIWFDPSNYSDPTTTFGTCAPQLGGLRGPGFYNWDISLQKNFSITERFKFQFRTDFLNTFNTVNLGAPNTTVATTTTGVIQIAQPAREIQFALKLNF
ncbi:MAG: carboxypeptidase regulatory-like domain-containing protein [Candidatus Acidiferrum sp.]